MPLYEDMIFEQLQSSVTDFGLSFILGINSAYISIIGQNFKM